MIQFNLLPDVKLDYIKAKKTKRLVILIATLAGGGMLTILIVLFLVVNVLQKRHLKNLNNDVKTYSQKLQNTVDVNKILTIQNQLKSLPDLHNKKVVATRIFNYLSQVTPSLASIAKFNIDFSANTMSFTGSADSLNTINKFVDTLKFTTFATVGSNPKKGNAFSGVVLASFNRDNRAASYQINTNFDPIIFDSANDVNLSVPHIISTRSETEKPTELFQPGATINTNGSR